MGRIKKKYLSKFFLKIISLDSEYRPFAFIFLLVLLSLIPISFLESSPNLSVCSRLFGDYCYSVGLTRGVSSLLKGDFSLALNYNSLSPIVLLIILLIIFNDFRNRLRVK